jgi:cation diffusion facilitator CzcD-associated flavoprotein CzcO
VQLIQDIAPIVEHLTVFQRTPNTALPMVQRKLPPGGHDKATYPSAFRQVSTLFVCVSRL